VLSENTHTSKPAPGCFCDTVYVGQKFVEVTTDQPHNQSREWVIFTSATASSARRRLEAGKQFTLFLHTVNLKLSSLLLRAFIKRRIA